MGPTLAHSLRMRLLLLLILPFLNGRSIVRERNDVIKQALIPTLVNIIGHARMVEHGTGDDVDNLLDFMDEEKILDPFLSWLGWFTDMVVKGDDTSSEETVVRERNDVIKQALIPTLVNIIRHARMAEHGTGIDELLDLINKDKLLDPFLKWLGWFTDKILEKDAEETDDKSDESGEITEYDEQELEQKVLEKEQSMEEAIKEIVKEEEEEERKDLPEEDKVMEEEVMEKETALEESLEEEIVEEEEEKDMVEEEEEGDMAEEDIVEEEEEKDLAEEEIVEEEKEDGKDLTEEESLEEVTEVAVAWPGDPKGYNGPEIPKGDDMPAALPIEDEVSQNTQWA